MKMRQWIQDKLFDLLTWLTPNEQPNIEELRAHAREEVQQTPEPTKIWFDPTVRSYPQQPPPVLHLPTGQWSKMWYVTHPAKPEPVIRTNSAPLDPATDFPPWLNSVPLIAVEHMTPAEIEKVPTKRDLRSGWDKDKTEERTAIDKLLYQGQQERRARQAG